MTDEAIERSTATLASEGQPLPAAHPHLAVVSEGEPNGTSSAGPGASSPPEPPSEPPPAPPRTTVAQKPPRRPGRGTWGLIVGLFGAIAIAAPAKIVVTQLRATSSSAAGGSSGPTAVLMAGLKFSPNPVIVPKGTTVTFDNNDVVPHTVTQDGPAVPGGVDSGLLGPGKSYQLVMSAPLAYHCAIHPFMQASVELEG